MVPLLQDELQDVTLSKRDASARATKARKHFDAGDYEKALSVYESLLAEYPDSAALHGLAGIALYELRRFDESIAHLKEALAAEPDVLELWASLGTALGASGHAVEAVRVFDDAIAGVTGRSPAFEEARQLALAGKTRDAILMLDVELERQTDPGAPVQLALLRKILVDRELWQLVHTGFGSWSGGKPLGSTPPIEVTPGPPISDFIIQDRR